MADEQTIVDAAGVDRTATGQIADQNQTLESSPTTNQETKPAVDPKATDGKTLLTEGDKESAKTEGDKKDAVTGAPEKYEDYKVPDGYTLDPEVKKGADELFKGLGLNQAQAQSLVDFYTKQTSEAFAAPYKAFNQASEDWRQESENHPDLRGKLGPGKEISVRIGKALDSIGDSKLTDAFKQHMDITRAGNYWAFIKTLDWFAQRVTEGTHVAGTGPSTAGQSKPGEAPPTVAGALWPNLPSAMNPR